jgi:hypothetical protein
MILWEETGAAAPRWAAAKHFHSSAQERGLSWAKASAEIA